MLEVERIGRLRKQLGLTQKELADLAGVSQSLVAKIESGKIDPAYSKVMQILSALENEQNKGKKTAQQIMSLGLAYVSPSD
ncbi:MAG: helix-turn-helix domain-containing protein, partial [Nitrososphaera sp.]|nr:helix-turn-helix domain-containing protein [Nitrososphaera sp.]